MLFILVKMKELPSVDQKQVERPIGIAVQDVFSACTQSCIGVSPHRQLMSSKKLRQTDHAYDPVGAMSFMSVRNGGAPRMRSHAGGPAVMNTLELTAIIGSCGDRYFPSNAAVHFAPSPWLAHYKRLGA